MNDFESVHTARAGGSNTITLFLGLFLLILAFFIVLVSISTIEETKSKEVMDSLTSTFADLTAPATDPTDFSSKSGEFLSPESFQQLVTGVFSAAVAVDRVEIVQPGRVMRVDLRAHELFVVNKPDVRDTRLELMDRITGALSASPPGYRFEMAFLIGSALSTDDTLPIEQNLESRRAGSFARTAIGRGAPPVSISVGVVPGDPKTVSIYFYVREEDAARLQFSAPEIDDFRYDDPEEDGPTPTDQGTESSNDQGPGVSVPLPLNLGDRAP